MPGLYWSGTLSKLYLLSGFSVLGTGRRSPLRLQYKKTPGNTQGLP